MSTHFPDIDFTAFWDDHEYYADEYTDDPLTDEKIRATEAALGYRLPASYIELMRTRNGGGPVNTCHRTATPTSWAEDHVALSGLLAIGDGSHYSLCSDMGSQFWIDEWGYPPIGIYFADCPSAGHDMLCLDYRACGPQGEPCVVHVDQEDDYRITHVADDFASFVRGLLPESEFDYGDGDDDDDA